MMVQHPAPLSRFLVLSESLAKSRWHTTKETQVQITLAVAEPTDVFLSVS